MKTFKFIGSFLRPYWARISFVFLLLAIEVSFYSSFTYSIQFIISYLANKQMGALVQLFLFLLVGFMLAVICSTWRCFFYANLSSDIIRDLRMKVFDSIQKLSVRQLALKGSSKLLQRFNEVDLVGSALAVIDKSVIYSLLSFFASLTLMSIINIKLTIVAILLIPLLFLSPKIIVPKINVIGEERETEEQISTFALENILLQPIIRILGLQGWQKTTFDEKNTNSSIKYRKIQSLNSLVASSADLMPVVLRILIFALGSYFVLTQNFSIAALVSFEFVFSQLIYSLIRIFYSVPTVTLGYAALKSIRKFITEEPEDEVQKKEIIPVKTILKPSIRFHNVSFGYDPKFFNVSNLNFEIPYKTYAAFVGANGAGKSTLINLLLNFYNPNKGTIEINKITIDSLAREDLYKAIGYVPQEAILFNTSIRENIRIGKIGATDAEVESAAKKAEMHHAVNLMPDKYDTLVGFRGERLSGGQRKRIVLARALIRNPKILLLDEIAASLDPISEAAINKTISEISKECTIISVAHHLPSVMDADCIYVLEKGAIAEFGKHSELLEKNGIYHAMWNKQHGFLRGKSTLISKERLKAIPLFSGIPDESLEMIRYNLRMMTFPEDSIIFRQGDIGDFFYIIVRGSIEITKVHPEKFIEPVILEEGDYFGKRGLTPRTATARAVTSCVLLAFSFFELNSIIELHPVIKDRLDKRVNEG